MTMNYAEAVKELTAQMTKLRDRAVVSGVIGSEYAMPILDHLADEVLRELVGADEALGSSAAWRIVQVYGMEKLDTVGFWQTQVSRGFAWRVGYHRSEVLTGQAALILGITRQGVHHLLKKGLLLRPAGSSWPGAITAESLRSYLQRRPLKVI